MPFTIVRVQGHFSQRKKTFCNPTRNRHNVGRVHLQQETLFTRKVFCYYVLCKTTLIPLTLPKLLLGRYLRKYLGLRTLRYVLSLRVVTT